MNLFQVVLFHEMHLKILSISAQSLTSQGLAWYLFLVYATQVDCAFLALWQPLAVFRSYPMTLNLKGYTIPAWIRRSSVGYSQQPKWISHPVELTPFNDFDTLITEQANKHKWYISVQGSKGWDQSMGHCQCNLTSEHESKQASSEAREALHPGWDQVILHACIFPHFNL